jgi:cytochrome P450
MLVNNALVYLYLAIAAIVLRYVAVIIYNTSLHPLSPFPGPFFARYTRLWLVFQTLRQRRHSVDLALHEQYGPFVRVAPNELLISDARYFKSIYGIGSHFTKSSWYQAMGHDAEDGFNLLAETNMQKYWHQRRLISPAFTTRELLRHEELLSKALNRFVTRMELEAGTDQPLVKWMNILSLDVLTEMTFGRSADYILQGHDCGNSAGIDRFWQHLSWIGLLPEFSKYYKCLRKWLAVIGIPLLYHPDTSKLSVIQVRLANHNSQHILTR